MPLLGQLGSETSNREYGSQTTVWILLTRSSSLVLAINGITADIEEVPDLIQLAILTTNISILAVVQIGQGRLDLAEGVSLGIVGGDARFGESLCMSEG